MAFHTRFSKYLLNRTLTNQYKNIKVVPSITHLNCLPLRHSSFAENLFIGKIEQDFLFPYPSYKNDVNDVNELSDSVEKFLDQQVNSHKLDADRAMDGEVLRGLKDMGLFALSIPEEYGGLGLNALDFGRITERALCKDASVYRVLMNHNMAAGAILNSGSEDQKQKYLPAMASGDVIGAFCYCESPDGVDAGQIETTADLDIHEENWVLSGEKRAVVNGNLADIFVVFAKTALLEVDDRTVEKITAFIVEKNVEGFSVKHDDALLGGCASGTATVNLEHVLVPTCNVLGRVGSGYRTAVQSSHIIKQNSGSYASGLIKRMVEWAGCHANERSQFGQKLSNFELIRDKILTLNCEAYALESASVLICGQESSSVESSILKVYSSECLWRAASECLQVFGGLGYMKDYPYERVLRDSSLCLVDVAPNYLLKMQIALTGLKFASKTLPEETRNMRGLLSPTRKYISRHSDPDSKTMRTAPWKRSHYSPALTFKEVCEEFSSNVHPEMTGCARVVNFCLDKFYTRLLTLVAAHGNKLAEDELKLEQISDACTKIFMMCAVLARCNRSMLQSPGAESQQRELEIATVYINRSYEEISGIFVDLHPLFGSLREDFSCEQRKVSERILHDREYIFSHPLELAHRYIEHPKYLQALDSVLKLK